MAFGKEPGGGSGSGCPLADQIPSLPLLEEVSTHHSFVRRISSSRPSRSNRSHPYTSPHRLWSGVARHVVKRLPICNSPIGRGPNRGHSLVQVLSVLKGSQGIFE